MDVEITDPLLKTDLVQEHMDRAAQYVARDCSERFYMHACNRIRNSHPSRLGSPAEAVFLAWATALEHAHHSEFRFIPQVEIECSGKKYRADFQVEYRQNHSPFELRLPLLVEIDGHAWHEKTRAQVEKRNTRDRDLLSAGYIVLHFSFSELMADPVKCIESVFLPGWDMVHAEVDRMAELAPANAPAKKRD